MHSSLLLYEYKSARRSDFVFILVQNEREIGTKVIAMASHEQQLGRVLAKRRRALGFRTQQSLAEATGVLRTRISAMENGRYTGRLTDLNRVLATLGLEMDFRVATRPTLDDLETLFPEDED